MLTCAILGTIYDAIGVQKSTNQTPIFVWGSARRGRLCSYYLEAPSPTLIFREASVDDWYAVTDSANPIPERYQQYSGCS